MTRVTLLRRRKKQQLAVEVAAKALRETVERLSVNCQHEETKPHEWEHDNGYGVQHMITGRRCTICWATDHYNDGRWLKP